ncbi:MAG: VWA domain-containing protein [Acidobacteriota bacterium]
MSRHRGAAALVAFLALTGGGSGVLRARQATGTQQTQAQTPPADQQKPQQPPVFRAGVNFVRVDVIVTDKDGNPVTDLTEADFEIVEDGASQAIELFKLVSADGNPKPGGEAVKAIRSRYDEESEAARDDVRLFVIFLDDYHVRLGSSMRVRGPLSQWVANQLGPLDMVAVMYPLTSVADLGFTRDRQAVVSAIRKFEGRKYDYRPRNQFEEQYAMYPAQAVETVRNQVTMSALEGVSVKLGAMREGRKAVIFVSEGFTALLPPQMRDPNAQFPGLGNPNRNNPFAGENPAEDRSRFFSEADLQNQMRDVYDAANRNNTAIYALDPRGLAPAEFDISENVGTRVDTETLRQSMDTLRVLADQTDGRAIVNQNDLERGLKQVIRDTSSYYLVGYSSSAPTDGKYHKIEVRLKRPGLDVRARKGYWAATAKEAAAAAAPPKATPPAEVERALGTVETGPRDSVISTWFGLSRGVEGRTRVTFVWEPVPPTLGLARDEPVQVQVLAAGGSGETYYRGNVPEEPTDPSQRAPSSLSFDAAPGRVQFRLAVRNTKGQVIDSVLQEIAVPDLTEPGIALGTPAVYRARTAREFQALTRAAAPVPTALRSFRRTDRLLIRFDVYAPGATRPAVAVNLLNRVGTKMTEASFTAPAEGSTSYQVDLPLAGFAAGEYVIEIKAMGESGEASQLIGVRITS